MLVSQHRQRCADVTVRTGRGPLMSLVHMWCGVPELFHYCLVACGILLFLVYVEPT